MLLELQATFVEVVIVGRRPTDGLMVRSLSVFILGADGGAAEKGTRTPCR